MRKSCAQRTPEVSDSTTRLELALEAFLAFQQRGGSRTELLARNPQLADHLEAMLEGL